MNWLYWISTVVLFCCLVITIKTTYKNGKESNSQYEFVAKAAKKLAIIGYMLTIFLYFTIIWDVLCLTGWINFTDGATIVDDFMTDVVLSLFAGTSTTLVAYWLGKKNINPFSFITHKKTT